MTAARPTFARKGFVTFGAISLLLIFFVGEISLQKLMLLHSWTRSTYCSSPYQSENFSTRSSLHSNYTRGQVLRLPKTIIRGPTVHEAFETKVVYLTNITARTSKSSIKKTVIEPNRNVFQFGLTALRNVCMRPDGAIVMVGMSDAEIRRQISKVPALEKEWESSYNCTPSNDCTGLESMSTIPSNTTWVSGTTTHILPYLGNVFHNFADRVWPHIAGFAYPLNETTPHPINHFLLHSFSTWLDQAHHSMDRNTLMYQFQILSRLSPEADFLLADGLDPTTDLVCYETLILACATCDRVSSKLGSNITRPALLNYRQAALNYLRIQEPLVVLPPRPLRVTFYSRRDTRRRRVTNSREVVDHLKSWTNPPLDVTFVDEVMASGEYNQSLPEVVSLFSQTDIFITVHGANTWAALFMPKHAAVIEIYGPCGPSSWLGIIVDALELKHSTESNPYGEVVASPDSGNTTQCEDALHTPDFTLDIPKLDDAIHELALPIFGYRDRIPRHWLHDWSPKERSLTDVTSGPEEPVS